MLGYYCTYRIHLWCTYGQSSLYLQMAETQASFQTHKKVSIDLYNWEMQDCFQLQLQLDSDSQMISWERCHKTHHSQHFLVAVFRFILSQVFSEWWQRWPFASLDFCFPLQQQKSAFSSALLANVLKRIAIILAWSLFLINLCCHRCAVSS